MTFGVDFAWGRPGTAALQKAGVRFVCRYLSHDTTGKNLTAAEAKSLTSAGIWIVVVWESTAQRALAGHAAGVADAQAAVSQAHACGMPSSRPIYFAVDFDASAAQQAAINAYLDGAASVLGRARVGIYGGYYVVKRALDGGHAAWAWQTLAWSGGHWDGRAQLQQYSNDHLIGGVGCDYDRATRDDYGQWRVGAAPKEDDMEPTTSVKVGTTWAGTFDHDAYPAGYLWVESVARGRRIEAALAALAKNAGVAVDEAAIVQGVLAGLSPETIAQHVVDAMPADEAVKVVDAIGARLAQPSSTGES